MNAIMLFNINQIANKKPVVITPKAKFRKYSLQYPDLTPKMADRYNLMTDKEYTTQQLRKLLCKPKQEVPNTIRMLLKNGYVRYASNGHLGGIYTVVAR